MVTDCTKPPSAPIWPPLRISPPVTRSPVGIGTVLCSTPLSWFRSVTMIELAAVPPVVVQAIGSSREALTSEVMPIA